MFGLTLKGNHVRTGDTNVFELQIMNCFTYVNGVMMLKLRSGKLIKSNLIQPKPLAPVAEALLDSKLIDLPCCMDNIAHPDDSPLLTRRP